MEMKMVIMQPMEEKVEENNGRISQRNPQAGCLLFLIFFPLAYTQIQTQWENS